MRENLHSIIWKKYEKENNNKFNNQYGGFGMSLENSKEMVRQIMSFAQKLENAINGRPAE